MIVLFFLPATDLRPGGLLSSTDSVDGCFIVCERFRGDVFAVGLLLVLAVLESAILVVFLERTCDICASMLSSSSFICMLCVILEFS